MKYDLVAFDFDGTLADTIPWFESVMEDVAEKYQFRKVSPHDRERLRECDSREILQYLDVPMWKMPMVVRHICGLMEQVSPDVRLFEGIDAALAAMNAAGVRLAVVSSNSLQNVQRVLGRDLARIIDHYECGVSLFGKSAKLKRLLQQAGIEHHRMILIGDELRDIDAAKQARIRSGAVAWGYNRLNALQEMRPDEIFLHVHEVPAKILMDSGKHRD